MATAQYAMPPAGTYQYQYQGPPQQSLYFPPQPNYPFQRQYYPPTPYPGYPQPQQYLAPPTFPQRGPPYPDEGRAPPPLPEQAWPTPANHAGEYMGPGYTYGSRYEDDTPDYNNPSQPQYGIPESKRDDPNFVFPDDNIQTPGRQGGDGERGFGATALGGAGGAFLGHKLEHGALGTIGGLAIGAIAANAFEHHEKKKKEEKRENRAFGEGYRDGERHEEPRHHHHSRDLDDDDYSEPPHHHRSRDLRTMIILRLPTTLARGIGICTTMTDIRMIDIRIGNRSLDRHAITIFDTKMSMKLRVANDTMIEGMHISEIENCSSR